MEINIEFTAVKGRTDKKWNGKKCKSYTFKSVALACIYSGGHN